MRRGDRRYSVEKAALALGGYFNLAKPIHRFVVSQFGPFSISGPAIAICSGGESYDAVFDYRLGSVSSTVNYANWNG